MPVPEALLVHLRRARDLIDREYAERLDLDALASEAGVSKYHFLRCFAATYGKTPAVYLAERRIERAQDLLRGDEPDRDRGVHARRLFEPRIVQLEVP